MNSKPEAFDRFMRLPEVVRTIGVSRSSIYAWQKQGLLPKAVQIGPRTVGWKESTIQRFISQRASQSN